MMPIGFGPMIDPITGQPIGYQPAPAPSPEPEQAPVTEQVWKPDFTKAEPWQGVPADYAGVATFVPTVENPLPPWEGEVAAEVLPTFDTPEYDALAQRIIDEARVTTAIGTAEEKAKAEIIIAAGETATLVRAGIEQVVTGLHPTRPPVKEIAEPEKAPVTEEVETVEYWKPDFTKAEPWQGVPADYAGVATFVPTNENPLPPWEGDVATAVIPAFNTPDYSALAQKIIDEARVTTQTGTAEEKARAEIIIASGEKSTLVRAGIEQVVTGKEPTRPTAAEVEGIGLGIVAVIALVAFAAGRK